MLDLYSKVNDLVVMGFTKKRGRAYYNMSCSFGHSEEVRCDSLKDSRVCSVCRRKDKRLSSLKRVASVYEGYIKGQLKVLTILPKTPYNVAKVLTECTCGNRQTMLTTNIVSTTQSWSCGRCSPYYKYEEDTLHVYYEGVGYKSELIVDKEDAPLILGISWTIHRGDYTSYMRHPTGDRVLLHRILTNCPDGMLVDHINGDGLDNRKCNLRVVSSKENTRNTKRNKNNSSGKMGVYYRGDSSKWRAVINGEYGREDLGNFSTKEEAIRIREDAEIFHGYHENHGRVILNKEQTDE